MKEGSVQNGRGQDFGESSLITLWILVPCHSVHLPPHRTAPPHPPLRASPASMDTLTTVGPISPVSSTCAREETKEGVTDSPINNRAGTGAFKSLTPLLQMSDRSSEVLWLETAEEVVSFH